MSLSRTERRLNPDLVVRPLLGLLAGSSAVLLLLIVGFLVYEAWPVLNQDDWRPFWRDDWYPLDGLFGLMPMLWSSLAAALGAALLATPLGLACALFLHYYAPPLLAKPFRLVLILLAGIPSVVYGLWGLTDLVPLIAWLRPPGASLLAAMLVLMLMILPTVALTSASALAALPRQLLTGAQALGMSRKGQILGVVLPAARSGIVSGVLLAIARALGETMAVMMVAGNVVQVPTGLLEPVRVLTANIALEMAYAADQHRAALFASGLLLTLLVLTLAVAATRRQQKAPRYG